MPSAVASSEPGPEVRRKSWIIAGFAAVLLLLFLSAFVSYYNLSALASSQDLEERSFQIRWSLVRILELLSDSETAQRGYIITGNESFLQPGLTALSELPSEMERLRRLLAPSSESQAQFSRLQELVNRKLAIIQQNIQARREGSFQNAERQVASGAGKAAMDAVRRQIAEMDSIEVARLERHSDQTDAAAERAKTIVLGASVLAAVTAGLSLDQVRRGFAERARAKAEVEKANAELEERVERRTAELRYALERLEAENRQRKELEQQLLLVSEREQRRVAEDLHDGQGQLLAGALHLVTAHIHRLSSAGVPEVMEAENIKQLIREALEQTRSVARGLYPVKEIPKGLMLALQDLAARTQQMFEIDCQFVSSGPILIEDHALATHLFRIAHEAVNNAVKHGHATGICIRLTAGGNSLQLCVQDNGSGLPRDFRDRNGLGLRMMEYRAEMIRGHLRITQPEEGGTCVECTAPLNSKSQG